MEREYLKLWQLIRQALSCGHPHIINAAREQNRRMAEYSPELRQADYPNAEAYSYAMEQFGIRFGW